MPKYRYRKDVSWENYLCPNIDIEKMSVERTI